MRILIYCVVTSFFYSCVYSQEIKSKTATSNAENNLYIDLSDYDIKKQNVEYIPNLDFKNAIIVGNLNFFPNKYDYYNFFKSPYKGKVKEVTVYKKRNDESYQRFDRIDRYNEKGYLIESEYEYAGNHYYTYDDNNNLIKEINVIDGDTVTIKDIYYNSIGKIEKIKLNNLKEKKDYMYNLDISILYNSDGSPSKIMNNNPKDKYVKEIYYNGNQVDIVHKSSSEVRKQTFIYSKTYQLLKEENRFDTTFNKYDENDKRLSCMTYRDGEYCCTDFYYRDNNDNLINRTFTNHLKDHKEINTYSYRFDDHQNIIYQLHSNSVLEREYETYYEFEYFEE